MSDYTLTAAGKTAFDIIHERGSAAVMGVTSRGVFCNTPDGQVFFLSYETWRGPLTANLRLDFEDSSQDRPIQKEQRRHPQSFARLKHGSTAKLYPDRIHFKVENITIHTGAVSAWEAAIRPIDKDGVSDARRRLANTARIVLEEGGGKGWMALLPRWAGLEIQTVNGAELIDVEKELQHLVKGLHAENGSEIILRTSPLLGRGAGLTPSGDDLVIGLLLGLRALSEISALFRVVNEHSTSLFQLARQKTTTLAANLIVCALEGQADERLVSALDGILWGSLPEIDCARRLLDYGSSSGGDTLLGITVALNQG